jgi:hypothetical protein
VAEEPEVLHHAAPRCLLSLHEKVNGTSLDGEGLQAWLEWEMEAMRWRVPAGISRDDLEALVKTSEVVLEQEMGLPNSRGPRRGDSLGSGNTTSEEGHPWVRGQASS